MSSCTIESVYSVIQWFSQGRRQLKSKDANRAPGSLRENFTASVVFAVLKKLFRKLCSVIGSSQGAYVAFGGGVSWHPRPFPPQMTIRSKPNSTLGVGLKLSFSTCSHGSRGAECPFKLPTKKSYRNGPTSRDKKGINRGSVRSIWKA